MRDRIRAPRSYRRHGPQNFLRIIQTRNGYQPDAKYLTSLQILCGRNAALHKSSEPQKP